MLLIYFAVCCFPCSCLVSVMSSITLCFSRVCVSVCFLPLGPVAIFNEMHTLLITDRCLFPILLLNALTADSLLLLLSHSANICSITLTFDLLCSRCISIVFCTKCVETFTCDSAEHHELVLFISYSRLTYSPQLLLIFISPSPLPLWADM